MDIFGIFKRNKAPSANLAKERLKIIVEHSRADAKRPEFLNDMRREILAVVQKYIEIDLGDIDANINNMGETEMLELNILLPDTVDIEEKQKVDDQVKKATNQIKEIAESEKVQVSRAKLVESESTELETVNGTVDKTPVKKTTQTVNRQRQQTRTSKS